MGLSLKMIIYKLIIILLIMSLVRINTKASQSPPSRNTVNIEISQSKKSSEIKHDYLVGYVCGNKTITRAVVAVNRPSGLSAKEVYVLEKRLKGNFCTDPKIFSFQRLSD